MSRRTAVHSVKSDDIAGFITDAGTIPNARVVAVTPSQAEAVHNIYGVCYKVTSYLVVLEHDSGNIGPDHAEGV